MNRVEIKDKVVVQKKPRVQVLANLNQHILESLSQLLKRSYPNREKAHRLNKLLQSEKDGQTYEQLHSKILNYYHLPFERRTAGQFLKTFGIHPYPWLMEQFILNFSTAHIASNDLVKLSVKFRHLIKTSLDLPQELIDSNFIYLVLNQMTHPKGFSKTSGLTLTDFVRAWSRASQRKWGEKFNHHFAPIFEDLDTWEYKSMSPTLSRGTLEDIDGNEMDLSQTDLDWMKEILLCLKYRKTPPPYPLKRGPKHPPTRSLEKIVRLIEKIQSPKKLELLRNTAKVICLSHLRVYGR